LAVQKVEWKAGMMVAHLVDRMVARWAASLVAVTAERLVPQKAVRWAEYWADLMGFRLAVRMADATVGLKVV